MARWLRKSKEELEVAEDTVGTAIAATVSPANMNNAYTCDSKVVVCEDLEESKHNDVCIYRELKMTDREGGKDLTNNEKSQEKDGDTARDNGEDEIGEPKEKTERQKEAKVGEEQKLKRDGKRGSQYFVKRAEREKMKARLEQERQISLSPSSNDDEENVIQQDDNNARVSQTENAFSDVDSLTLDEITEIERRSQLLSQESGSSSDFEVERVVVGMLDDEKSYRTPVEIDED